MMFLDEFHPAIQTEHLAGFTDRIDHVFGRSFIDRVLWPDNDALRTRTTGADVEFMGGSVLASITETSSAMLIGHVIEAGESAYLAACFYPLDMMAVIGDDVASGVELLTAALLLPGGEVHWLGDVRVEGGLVVVSCVSCTGRCETVTIEPVTERVLDRLVEDHTSRPRDASRVVRRLWDSLALAHQIQGSAKAGYLEIFSNEEMPTWP